jgi:hypothetical protein
MGARGPMEPSGCRMICKVRRARFRGGDPPCFVGASLVELIKFSNHSTIGIPSHLILTMASGPIRCGR